MSYSAFSHDRRRSQTKEDSIQTKHIFSYALIPLKYVPILMQENALYLNDSVLY